MRNWALMVAAATACAQAGSQAHAAGAAFAVDTAEISDVGNCKVEAWTSWANNGKGSAGAPGSADGLATVNPACVIETFSPTEISAQVVRSRGDDEWATSLTPKAKARLIPTAIGSFGFAAAVGASYDPKAHETTTVFAYIPATLRLSENVRINLNGGWQLDRTTDRHFATYGVGLDWRVTDTVILTAETFGQAGTAETASETRPRYQAGVRYRPVDQFNVDVIYGRNINGENADWLTVSTTIRFPPK